MAYEDERIRERVHMLMHREGLSQRELADRIGKRPAHLSQILTGQRKVPRSLTNDILNAFPNLNRDWFVFGEGAMYEGEERLCDALPQDTRPRLPKFVSDCHLEDYYNGEKRVLCQEKPIVEQFCDYDFSLILKNDRMSPKYNRGDELFFKKATIKEWGNDYLLDTDEGPKFKKILPGKNGDYRCVSYNREEYPEFTIPGNMVKGFYKLVGVLRIL